MTGDQKLKFMCLPCSAEHNRFIQSRLKPSAAGLSQQEQLALIRKVNVHADRHMKQWVLDGGSR